MQLICRKLHQIIEMRHFVQVVFDINQVEYQVPLKTLIIQMKYTQHTLDKTERVIEEGGYVIRYERGTFQSGYCILQEKKVVVLNKFLQTEGRINTLIDLLPLLKINIDDLTHESQKLYEELMTVDIHK